MLITSPWFLAKGRTTASRGILIEPRLSRPYDHFTATRIAHDIASAAAKTSAASNVALVDHHNPAMLRDVGEYLANRAFRALACQTPGWNRHKYFDLGITLEKQGLVVIPNGSAKYFLTAVRALGLLYPGIENDHTWLTNQNSNAEEPTPEVQALAFNLDIGQLNQGPGTYQFFLNQVKPLPARCP